MNTQPSHQELERQERFEKYLIAAQQANVELASEMGWDMESGPPSYICDDDSFKERVQQITADIVVPSNTGTRISEKLMATTTQPIAPSKAMTRRA